MPEPVALDIAKSTASVPSFNHSFVVPNGPTILRLETSVSQPKNGGVLFGTFEFFSMREAKSGGRPLTTLRGDTEKFGFDFHDNCTFQMRFSIGTGR